MKQEIFIVYQEDPSDHPVIVGLFSNMKSAYECRSAGRKAGRTRWVEDYCVDDSYIPERDFSLVDYEEDEE